MEDFDFLSRFRTKGEFKTTYADAKISYLKRIRWSVGNFYFAMGLCFASWASRIPDVKTALHLSEGQLGTLLFAVPLGQLLTMPLSGKLVTRFGSRNVVILALILYAASLVLLGIASSAWQLSAALFLFGIFGNLSNIAVNTQGVYTEVLFKKTIMSSFHGLWSFAGFTGALVGLGMLALQLTALTHFLIIAGLMLVVTAFNYKNLIKAKETMREQTKKRFTKPDSGLLWLGVIAFCCMASEGVMFDWSGVYFKEIVKVPGALVILGYTSFMIMMAAGRFLGDRVIRKVGSKKILQISGIVISTGLLVSVIFPYLIVCVIAFMLVGLGVSTIVPTVYSNAGKNKTIPPGEALSIVSSVGFLGFLMGPPVIGYIAELSSLRLSFAFIGIFGFLIAAMASKMKIGS